MSTDNCNNSLFKFYNNSKAVQVQKYYIYKR